MKMEVDFREDCFAKNYSLLNPYYLLFEAIVITTF